MTYDEYLTLGGEKIPEGQFERLAARAEAMLEKITGGRLSEAGNSAKYAIFELAESLFTAQAVGAVVQETNDGYSVTYSTGAAAERSSLAGAMSIARVWLPEELLYRGVGKRDCGKCQEMV